GIANTFVKNGWQVDLVVLNLKNEAYLGRLSNKVNLVVLNVDHARFAAFSLLKYIYKNKINLFLVFNYELSVVLVLLRTIFKIKIKIISRNISTFSEKMIQFYRLSLWDRYVVAPLIKIFYHHVDYLINQSNGMRDDIISIYPKLTHKTEVIFNPIPIQLIDYANKNDLSKVKKENYLLCIGRLEKIKGFHHAIKAFAGIVKKYPYLQLKIVGKGSEESNLKQLAKDYSVSDKVDFEGFKKDIIPYYLKARVTILPSLYEGYPNVLIESISMNTPVIAFDCPSGPNEIIIDGRNGYLVKNQDVDDLKKKMLNFPYDKFDYKDLVNSIKKNNISKVYKQYESLVKKFC
ncbi:glycosyltransferase, partial [Candidatus Pelagibacter bacterium]|nr:glycosyltransferase [Candidatus Pelagibacter bacterium]